MSSSLRPQFFCTRPNGTLSPLIAVDELPSHISIRGISRELSPSETQGMTSLGIVSPRAQFYVVEGITPTTTRASAANTGSRSRNYDLQPALMRFITDDNIPANQRLALHSLLQQGLSQNWFINNPSAGGWLVSSNGNDSANGSARQQQGCLYKHEMPNDLSMLEKLGLRDIPRWYREKYGIPSLVPHGNGHPPRSQIGNGHHWKDDGQDHASIKSIQYPPRLGINGGGDHSGVEKNVKQKVAAYNPSLEQTAAASAVSPPMYQCTSPPSPVSQKHGPKNSNQVNLGSKKIDLLSFDHMQEYSPLKADLSYCPKETGSFETVDKAQREGLMRNLQSLVPAAMPVNPEYLTFDPSLGPNRSKKMQKSRRLYQPRSHASMPPSGLEMANSDPLNVFQNQTGASSSSAQSVGSKNTYSQITSPVVDPVYGSIMSESPPRGISPSVHSGTSLSSESSPGVYRTRVKDKGPRRTPGVIGNKKPHRKRSVGSSEEDLFGLGMAHGQE